MSTESASPQSYPDSGVGMSVLALIIFWPLGTLAVIYSVLAEVASIHNVADRVQAYTRAAAYWRQYAFAVGGAILLFGLLVAISAFGAWAVGS